MGKHAFGMWPEDPRVAAVEAGRCPRCSGQLTRAEVSPGGYRHCFRCRCGFKIQELSKGKTVEIRRHDDRRRG
jgi:hypothetical protein